MKKKKIIIAIASVALISVMCLIGAKIIITRNDKSATWEFTQGLDQISFMETGAQTEGSLCMVFCEGENAHFFSTFFGEYIAFDNGKTRRYRPDGKEEYIEEDETYIIDFYNYRTGEIERTLDMVAIAAEYTPGKQYCPGMDAMRINGKRYFEWKVHSIEEPKNFDLTEYMVYDLDEGKIVDNSIIDEYKYTEDEEEYFKSFYILCDRYCNFKEINGFITEYEEGDLPKIDVIYTRTWRDGIIEVIMQVSDMPDENARLYGEFPELKGYEAEGEEEVKFCFAGYPDAEEVLGMLLEEGTEITFEGCILEAENAVDGQEHEISCVDDYIKWCNWKRVIGFS